MAFTRSERRFYRLFSPRIMTRLALFIALVYWISWHHIHPMVNLEQIRPIVTTYLDNLLDFNVAETGTHDNLGQETKETAKPATASKFFAIPQGFEERVAFWIKIYSQYTSEDAVFHDSQNLSVIYKVVDLRPIMNSELHPFVKEHRVKRLIEKERKILLTQLNSLKAKLGSKTLNEDEQRLFEQLGQPKKKSVLSEAIENLRMQLGQKSYIEKALINSDLYLPAMEKIFEKKGLPVELTRMPFVESSFNLAARSRVGASGIWQIMPATGRKLMPNRNIDYRNDPIKATDFAASLLKFNYKVIEDWPLAITAYNHGPTSILKLTKKYGAKDLPTLIKKVYGSHAFAFASANFYACFLAILEIENNRSVYFPEVPKGSPIEFTSIQLKKPIQYSKLLEWFEGDRPKADQFNPHIASTIKTGKLKIPAGTVIYVPGNKSDVASLELIGVVRKI